MKKIFTFIKQVRAEAMKIIWPNRETVIRSTIMIMVFAGLVALFLFVIDWILNLIVNWIF